MPGAPRRILLGVTGSIAAYKTPQLVRDLLRIGAEVRVAMTHSAGAFVTPLTLATVSRNPVIDNPLPTDAGAQNAGTWHIDLARWADLMLIAPASANTIAKLAQGRADSAVTMLALAAPCPVVVAPAMDEDMLVNPATQDNLTRLRERGVHIIDPASGALASGLEGSGRLAELDTIVDFVGSLLEHRHALEGITIIVTAGPTHEPIDPVRFIGNNSSGKMGFAVANAAAMRGADVTLIAGPTFLHTPPGVRRVDVGTAHDMQSAITKELKNADVLIMAAAVADYSAASISETKKKKDPGGLHLDLNPTPDILAGLSAGKGKRIHIGFALETDNGLEHAKKKLQDKNLDCIVLNSATGVNSGIGGDDNTITLINRDESVTVLPRMSKRKCAELIVDRVTLLLGMHH